MIEQNAPADEVIPFEDVPVKDGFRDGDEGSFVGRDPRPIEVPNALVAPSQIGLWQCLAPKGCEPAMKREPFEGPLQSEAKDLAGPIQCPTCGNINVIFVKEK